jgi:hypothetical protein
MTGQALDTGLVERLIPFATLPAWLTAVSDGGAVRTAIERHVPEFASGELELRDCAVTRVRLKRASQSATCRLSYVSGGDERPVELLGDIVSPGAPEPKPGPNEAPFAADGWRCYLPELRLHLGLAPTEPALPAVSPLTDPEQARELLERAIRSGSSYPDVHVAAAHPKVARAKASRTTVLYELEYSPPDPGLPSPVIAKTYRGDKGANAYRGMHDLWSSKLGRSRVVSVAEPLAFIPDLNVLLQGPVRGADTTLKGLIRSAFASGSPGALDEVSAYVDKTAAGLAELHTSGVTSGDAVTWADRVADVEETVGRAAALSPGIDEAAAALLTRVGREAAEHPADAPVPTHGSFRPNQVLLHAGEIGFIDFDRFCQAEPGLDVASFLAAMKDAGRPHPDASESERAARLEALDALEDRFLARYREAAPVSKARIALWETIELFNAVLDCWTKMEAGLEARLGLLVHHLRRSGLAA